MQITGHAVHISPVDSERPLSRPPIASAISDNSQPASLDVGELELTEDERLMLTGDKGKAVQVTMASSFRFKFKKTTWTNPIRLVNACHMTDWCV